MRQLNVWVMLGIWAGLSLGAALYAAWEGYEGRAFAATVATFSILLLVMLTFAARRCMRLGRGMRGAHLRRRWRRFRFCCW